LQILFYYDIIVGGCCYSNLSVKFLLWIVYVPGSSVEYVPGSMCPVPAWIIRLCARFQRGLLRAAEPS